MAKSKRVCDRCGAKASPWIPRTRSNTGDQMLCAGCKQADKAQKTAELDSVPDRHPAGDAVRDHDFGWENGLAPEGYHPLAAPLPTEVWDRFFKKQELRGQRAVPMASQKAINTESQGSPEPPRALAPLRAEADLGTSSDGKKVIKTPNQMSAQGLHAHMTEDHGITAQEIENAHSAASSKIHTTTILHALHNHAHSLGYGTEGHLHSQNSSLDGGVTPENAWGSFDFVHQTPHSHEEHVAHLKHSHGLTDEELSKHTSPFGGTTGLAALHDKIHTTSAPDHDHSGHKDVGKPMLPPGEHADEIKAHLGSHHGMSQDEIGNIGYGHASAAALENHHEGLHKALGPALDHQHVPTVDAGVKSPETAAKEKMHQHLIEEHGYKPGMINGSGDFEHKAAHTPGAYGYKGHPGHEHGADADPTKMLTALPHMYKSDGKTPSDHKFQHTHASDMKSHELEMHMVEGHGHDFDTAFSGKSKEQLLQEHAQAHATGQMHPHTHAPTQGGLGDLGEKLYGGNEPEPQSNTHPSPESEPEALAHIIQHHPNISAEHYKSSGHVSSATKMQDFHAKLHAPDSGFPGAPDGHDHAPAQGPSTAIPVGSHLVSHHGMSQEEVAAMSPKQFKAHHEELHARHDEMDLGHSHEYPGGPVQPPRAHLPNKHHAMMRDDPDHPAVHEWYHGTSNDYDGPPKSATHLMEDHSFWGNWGGGDWNNHAGTHWTSLHEMAKDFASGSNSRVIHAKLHMKNPIVYNSLNHMAHDAYDRLHASGDMQDGGEHLGRHNDASGYNRCCSDALLAYAKGGHRSDGKYGVERYRDSLRASGHDGIVVRNQADAPEGHWNAIPLASDQIEITHASCRTSHGDVRDRDAEEFRRNGAKVKEGWQHPKKFDAKDYTGGKDLPTGDEVSSANEEKKAAPDMSHIRAGRGVRRGDADPLRNGRNLIDLPALKHPGSSHDDDDEDEEECEACGQTGHEKEDCTELYCSHCDEDTNHDSSDCNNKWCSVCEEHGDHEAEDEHPYCHHCDDYSDHDSDDHEDEWGEHPDKIRPEGYCPHCEANTKENYGKKECAECGEELPDHGKLVANSKPVKPEDYQSDGETDEANFGEAKDAPLHVTASTGNQALAGHLYHHHKSDVSGKEFEDGDGGWDDDKLKYHHQHLHADPAWAKSQGFTMNHEHPEMYQQYKPHEAMTPAEVHAHLLLAHSGTQAGAHGQMDLGEVKKMTPEESVEYHKKLHAADDAIPWGQKDSDGDLIAKMKHGHQGPVDKPTNAPDETSPHGEELKDHLALAHKMPGVKNIHLKDVISHPGVLEALHQHMHDTHGAGADPESQGYHTHLATGGGEAGAKQHMLNHLAEHHGIDEGHSFHEQYQKMNPSELALAHDQEHHSLFPMGTHPEHEHSTNNPHVPGWMGPQQKQASRLTLTDYFTEATA